MKHQLLDLLRQHEDLKLKPYKCTAGKTTIGYGRNLEDRGVTKEEAEYLLVNDVKAAQEELSTLEWYRALDEVRQEILINMCFNLGFPRLLLFQRMIAALKIHDYETAANEMMDSLWAVQVQGRAKELSYMMLNGKYA